MQPQKRPCPFSETISTRVHNTCFAASRRLEANVRLSRGPTTMPLHDWSDIPGWDGVRLIWMVELLYWIKPRLPAAYRAYVGTTPAFAIGAPVEGRPAVGVRDWPPRCRRSAAGGGRDDLGRQYRARRTGCRDRGRYPERRHDTSRRAARTPRRCHRAGLVPAQGPGGGLRRICRDVCRLPPERDSSASGGCPSATARVPVRRPDRRGTGPRTAACPAPCAIAYRVGEPAPNGGRFLALWRRPLTVGSPLPFIRLPLSL